MNICLKVRQDILSYPLISCTIPLGRNKERTCGITYQLINHYVLIMVVSVIILISHRC